MEVVGSDLQEPLLSQNGWDEMGQLFSYFLHSVWQERVMLRFLSAQSSTK